MKNATSYKSRAGSAELKVKIKALWEAGQSASQIGTALGITRNAAIGHVHRMKLATRELPSQRPTPRLRPARPKPVPAPEPIIICHAAAPTALNIDIMNMRQGLCYWPHDGQFGTTFCGHVTAENLSWCGFHQQIGKIRVNKAGAQ